MAKQITELRVELTVDAEGKPKAAKARYVVRDGDLAKRVVRKLELSEIYKVTHRSGGTGEFWHDLVKLLKETEGI